MFVGCGDDGPVLEGGADEVGETGVLTPPECAPFEGATSGDAYACEGEGNGWLSLDIVGAGNQNPVVGCLAYVDPNNVPANPTPDDCAPVPLDQIPLGVPAPGACCSEEADDAMIVDMCQLDCGYAACKTAIAAIRETADNLVPSNGVPPGVVDRTKSDLYAYADLLEAPLSLQYCAEKSYGSGGDVVSVNLGSGVSTPGLLGHVNDATVFVGCSLDPEAPFTEDSSGESCEGAPNIPDVLEEMEQGGLVESGTVTVFGPGLDAVALVTGASFEVREVLNRDMSIDFTLVSFDASLSDTVAGSFEIRSPSIALASAASGTLEGETVTFAPGTLRFVVTASVFVDGQPLFDGAPMRGEYTNTAATTATRGLDGSFAFIDATVQLGEYTAVLNTEPATMTAL